jgi:hypothetical protein
MKIKTRQISLSDIELIRYWRNEKFVREQKLNYYKLLGLVKQEFLKHKVNRLIVCFLE